MRKRGNPERKEERKSRCDGQPKGDHQAKDIRPEPAFVATLEPSSEDGESDDGGKDKTGSCREQCIACPPSNTKACVRRRRVTRRLDEREDGGEQQRRLHRNDKEQSFPSPLHGIMVSHSHHPTPHVTREYRLAHREEQPLVRRTLVLGRISLPQDTTSNHRPKAQAE